MGSEWSNQIFHVSYTVSSRPFLRFSFGLSMTSPKASLGPVGLLQPSWAVNYQLVYRPSELLTVWLPYDVLRKLEGLFNWATGEPKINIPITLPHPTNRNYVITIIEFSTIWHNHVRRLSLSCSGFRPSSLLILGLGWTKSERGELIKKKILNSIHGLIFHIYKHTHKKDS